MKCEGRKRMLCKDIIRSKKPQAVAKSVLHAHSLLYLLSDRLVSWWLLWGHLGECTGDDDYNLHTKCSSHRHLCCVWGKSKAQKRGNEIYCCLLELEICIKYNKVAAGAVKRNNFHFQMLLQHCRVTEERIFSSFNVVEKIIQILPLIRQKNAFVRREMKKWTDDGVYVAQQIIIMNLYIFLVEFIALFKRPYYEDFFWQLCDF